MIVVIIPSGRGDPAGRPISVISQLINGWKIPPMKRRRSMRLPDHDYRKQGAYFVTICTYRAQCVFGNVVNGEMILSDLGLVVRDEWLKTSQIRSNVELDTFTVMPNHLHGILLISDVEGRATQRVAPTGERENAALADRTVRGSRSLQAGSLGAIVGQFKSAVTKRCRRLMGLPELKIWQRGYYDSVIVRE